jgi:hypothetical protein
MSLVDEKQVALAGILLILGLAIGTNDLAELPPLDGVAQLHFVE